MSEKLLASLPCRLSLSDERSSSSYDSLGTGDVKGLKEEPANLGDEPLQNAIVEHEFSEGDEEDDGSECSGEKPET